MACLKYFQISQKFCVKIVDKLNEKCYHLFAIRNDYHLRITMRYSKQREAVYSVLKSTKTHPTVAWIHENAQKIIPDIGLGTVYRNLAELCEAGLIRKIAADNNPERYDADVTPHVHFVCTQCNAITDVDSSKVSLTVDIPQVTMVDLMLYGVCPCCCSHTDGNKN